MVRLLALAALVAAPLLVLTTGTTAAPTTGAGTTDPTGTAGATETGTGTTGTTGPAGATTETMPPVFEPCGCSSAGEGGGLAVLALLLTVGGSSRPRRRTR